MSHNVETMAYTDATPWHGLGKRVHNDLTPSQMLKEAGLDWQVEKIPAYVTLDSGTKIPIGRSALIRSTDEKVLDVVGEDWYPTQNHEAFDFFHEYVMAGDMDMHTAGSLREGQIVWALAKVKDSFELFGGDKVDSYLLFSNPHSYGRSIDIRFTPIRVVCNNTLTLSINTASSNFVKISHRIQFNTDQVKEVLGIASTKLGTYKETAQFLGNKRYTEGSIVDFFKEVFPVTGKKDAEKKKDLSLSANRAISYLDSQPGANFAEGSWWQAYNTVTYMADHVLSRDQDTRMYNSWYGHIKNLKVEALKKAVEYAKVA